MFSLSQTEDFEPYFTGRKRLLPRPSDLSFYNWETQTATSNPTPNYQVCIPSCFVLSVILCHWSDFPNSVEPPCTTTSRKRPPPISDRPPKHQLFPSKSLTVGTSSKQPPSVSDRDHFSGLTVNDFPLFQPLVSSLCTLKNIQRTFIVTTWDYTCRN